MVVTVVDWCGREMNDGGRDRPLLAIDASRGCVSCFGLLS